VTTTQTSTTSYHDQRLARRMEDSEFRREFERETAEITAVDAIVNALDELRAEQGKSKAELAREIGKNPASIRRLLTLDGSNPELRTVVAMANALEADIYIVPRSHGGRAAKTRRARRVAELA
jgi:DNA-binding phage protein